MGRRLRVGSLLLLSLLACGEREPRAASEQSAVSPLAGSSWRLVEFQSMDDAIGTIRPNADQLITIEFRADGSARLQLDCNRGNGSWSAEPGGDAGSGKLQLGPLATTRALCAPPNLGERLANDADAIRSYLLRDGRLHLSLLADAGIYVWEALSEDAATWIGRMRDALGGADAIAGLRSLSVAADCSGPGGAFHTEVASLRPDRVWFRQSRGEERTEVFSRPDRTWSIDAQGQPIEHDPGVRGFLRNHEFHLLLFELESRFADHRMGPPSEIRGRACASILMASEDSSSASIHLDAASALPVMLELNPEGAAGSIRVYFEDWRWKQGLNFFHAFDLSEGEAREFRYDYVRIEPNVVTEELFQESR